MTQRNVIYEVKDNIGWITLNRPDKLNAINDAMLAELDEILARAEPDLEVKVLVIRGAGRAFSAGQDLGGGGAFEVVPIDPRHREPAKELLEAERRRNRRWEYIFNLAKPTIAQVHGYCLGTGLYLAMVCDITIAAEDAQFGDPVSRMGLLSSMPLWLWLVGPRRTREMLFTGRYISGQEAEEWSLINKAVPAGELEDEVRRWAQGLALVHGDALAAGKDALNGAMEARGLGAAWRYTTDMQLVMQQRLPRSEEVAFWETRDKKGLRVAIESRDQPFQNFP
jgi:enoyl-CoA hydratase/carnithine racemase